MNPQTFNVWVGRLREEFRPTGTRSADADGAETPTFVPVEVTSESDAGAATGITSPPIEIEASGVTLRVAQDADTDVLTLVSLLPLLPRSPELNPVENVWQYMRDNWLPNRAFSSDKNIRDHCDDAWKRLADQPSTIMSIGPRDWAYRS